MRLAVAATPEVALPTLNALLKTSHDIAFIITQPDRPAGRGQELRESAVSDWARNHSIRVIKPAHAQELNGVLADIDLVITIGYGVILPQEILDIPTYGFINLHFSLLPRWRGAAPVQRAIEAGDSITGVSVFQLDAGMDTGPIYTAREIALDPQWTSADLFEVLAELGVPALLDTLQDIANEVLPTPQNQEGATRAHKISKAEANINWRQPAQTIIRTINAFTPTPGAWTTLKDSPIKISGVSTNSESRLAPGEIALVQGELLVGTLDKSIAIAYLRPAGKREMPATAWANGARLTLGDHFG